MSNKTPKLEDPEWLKQIAVGLFMLAVAGAVPLVFDLHGGDNGGGQQAGELGHSPLDKLIGFGDAAWATICAWAPVVLYAFGCVAGLMAVVLLVARQGRALVQATVRMWWTYRRPWARTLDQHGLLVSHGKKIKVPKLGKIRAFEAQALDVMQVRMPQGQDIDDWQEVAQPLALAFGATAGFVQPDNSSKKNPYQDIVLAFARNGGDNGMPRALPSARDMAALPMIPGYTRRPVTIRLSARAVILGWGSVQIDDGQTVRSVRLWSRRWQRQCLIVPVS